jgi:RNA polymerase sigma-70 factor, ECF subfamily
MNIISLAREDYIDNILKKYSHMVFRLALSQTKNKYHAEDVFQEVFLRVVDKEPVFNSEEHQKAWLIRTTINCSKKIFSSSWYKRTVPLEETLSFDNKEKGDVYFAVLDLPLKYRTVVYLFYYEDYSIAQISQILSLNESTIKSQLMRARTMLKTKLEGGLDNE